MTERRHAGDGLASRGRAAKAAPPAIASLGTATGGAAGGTSVAINGYGFLGTTGAASVLFGATNAASYVVNSDILITAVSPAHVAGAVDITVVAPGGVAVKAASFTFT
jgi:hypothetical protein